MDVILVPAGVGQHGVRNIQMFLLFAEKKISATSYLFKKQVEEKEKKSHFYYLLFYYLFLMLCLYPLSRLTSADSHPAQSY